MTDPGLTRRLRQQSHRSGLAVGLSMALAIAVCLGGFTWLYVQLDPWVRDFAGVEPGPTATERSEASNNGGDGPAEEAPSEEPEDVSTETPESIDPQSGNVSEGDASDNNNGEFNPDYQVTSLEAVRLRGGPGTSFEIVREVGPGTELEFLGNREAATDAEDVGLFWMEFKTADGDEGWIRDIDVGET